MMSDDWKPGDLALCVDDHDNPIMPGDPLRRGALYTVLRVVEFSYDTPALTIAGRRHHPNAFGYESLRFRKINPLTDEEREEALRDLNTPVREPVQ